MFSKKEGGIIDAKVDRRSFIRAMGQSCVVMGMGLSQKAGFAQQGQKKITGSKKIKRIAVESI
jgi:hypothetical protein